MTIQTIPIGQYLLVRIIAVCGLIAVFDGTAVAVSTEKNPLELANIILDQNATGDQKINALNEINLLSEEQRIVANKLIVAEGASDYAYGAAASLVMTGARDSINVIWAAFPRLYPLHQAGILGRIASAPDPRPLLVLPRRVLEDYAKKGSRLDPLQRDSIGALADVAGTSAQLLKSSKDPRDMALVQEAVRISPKSMAAWYAVAIQKEIPEDITDLAGRVMNDAALPDELRIAAAVVNGKKGIAGNEHIVRTLGAFVETFGKKTLREMVEPNEWSSPEYATLQQKLVMFYAALLVPREVVEKPVFDAISGRNELLQGMGLYLAVRLWPERVLEMVRTGAFAQDKAGVCAAIVSFHPNMRVEVGTFVNSSELDARLREMDATGVSVRGIPLRRDAFGILDASIVP